MTAVALLLAGPLPAQPTPAKKDNTLFLMVEAGPSVTEGRLRSTLRDGLRKSDCTIDGEPLVKAVSPTAFEEFQNLINETVTPDSALPAAGPVTERQLPSRENIWEFKLQSPRHELSSMSVKYRKAGEKSYQPEASSKTAPLSMIAGGTYTLKLEPGDEPEEDSEYTLNVLDPDGKEQTIKRKWPKRNRFYAITMRNFVGDRENLFKVVQDSKQVANPLDSIKEGRDLMFVFAKLDAIPPVIEPTQIVGNKLTVSVPTQPRRNPKRVWMLFPLTEEEVKKQLGEMRKIDDDGKVSDAVRLTKPAFNTDNVTVSAAMEPKWFELSPSGSSFVREIPLDDFPSLYKKFPKAYRLLIWEFEDDDGKNQRAILVQPAPPNKGEYYVIDEEVPGWAVQIEKKVNEKK